MFLACDLALRSFGKIVFKEFHSVKLLGTGFSMEFSIFSSLIDLQFGSNVSLTVCPGYLSQAMVQSSNVVFLYL